MSNDINLELLSNMLELQDELNTKTCGPLWKDGTTTEGRSINWKRYLRIEMVELIDSSDIFKHWKNLNGSVNWENMRMEAVDGWHFLMSEALIEYNPEQLMIMFEQIITSDVVPVSELNYFNTVDAAEDMIESTYYNGTYKLNNMFDRFFKLLKTLGMSYNELYTLYVVKNTLNTFRQNNGYKDGTYVKVINGLEDNVHITKLMETNPDITPDELYHAYDDFYRTENSIIA